MAVEPTLYIRVRNSFYPGYSCCSKCGANWGWKEWASHSTSSSEGLFLFCIDCDKVVTVEERWAALDNWKRKCKSQLSSFQFQKDTLEKQIQELDKTEFIEFPRNK